MVTIKIPWDRKGSLTLVRCLRQLGIHCQFNPESRQGSVSIDMDDEADARVLALWDELSDLRVRFIEENQRQAVEQLSYLEGE